MQSLQLPAPALLSSPLPSIGIGVHALKQYVPSAYV